MDIVWNFLQEGICNVNQLDDSSPPRTALAWCIAQTMDENDDYAQIIRLLLDHAAIDIGQTFIEYNRTVVHVAAGSGIRNTIGGEIDFKIKSAVGARLLFNHQKCKTFINVEDSNGMTALKFAVINVKSLDDKYAQIIEILLNHPQCDINLIDDMYEEQSAIHFVSSKHSQSHIGLHFLLRNKNRQKCHLNARDTNGDTALMIAVQQLKSNDDKFAKISELLLDQVDIDISIINKKGWSARCIYLEQKLENHIFRSTPALDVFKGLCRTAFREQRKLSLAFAITYRSYDVCKTLLECGVDVNDRFLPLDYQHELDEMFDSEADESYETALHSAVRIESLSKVRLLLEYSPNRSLRWRGLTALELALAYAVPADIIEELSKDCSNDDVRRLIQNYRLTDETDEDFVLRCGIKQWSDRFGFPRAEPRACECLSSKRNVHCNHRIGPLESPAKTKLSADTTVRPSTEDSDLIDIVKNCRLHFTADYKSTIADIKSAIVDLLEKASQIIAQTAPFLQFKPVLSGSSSEGTKVYLPNEFDFVCALSLEHNVVRERQIRPHNVPEFLLSSGSLSTQRLSVTFFHAIAKAFRDLTSQTLSYGQLRLYKHTVLFSNKIPKLQLIWKGCMFYNMKIYVDLIPAVELQKTESLYEKIEFSQFYLFSKTSRHNIFDLFFYKLASPFQLSHSHGEKAILDWLPKRVKHGYILAKAVRIVDIATPSDDVGLTFNLAENVHVDDFLSSHILKTCLFKVYFCDDNPKSNLVASDWAQVIYRELKSSLESKSLSSWCNKYQYLIDCRNCIYDNGCCMKRKLMLTMTENILGWLSTNKHLLGDIEFPDLTG